MVSLELVSMEMARFNGLPGYPRKPEGLRELALALQRVFATYPELKFGVDDLIRNHETCPKPANIYQLQRTTKKQAGATPTGFVGCPKCKGTGFVTKRDTRRSLHGTREFEFAYPCECRPLPPADRVERKGSLQSVGSFAGGSD